MDKTKATATPSTGIVVAASLNTVLGKIQDVAFETYLKTAQQDSASDDPRQMKLGGEKFAALIQKANAAASRVKAEVDDLQIERNLAVAEWNALHADDPTASHADLDTQVADFDKKIAAKQPTLDQLTAFVADAQAQLDRLGARFVSPALVSAGTVKVADRLRQAALVQAEKLLKRPASLPRAADHAQIATAQAVAAAVIDPLGSVQKPVRAQMKRANIPDTPDTPLWLKIRRASIDLGWDSYVAFLSRVMCCDPAGAPLNAELAAKVAQVPIALPFPGVDHYRFLKAATEVFMMIHCDTWNGLFPATESDADKQEDIDYAERRLGSTIQDLQETWDAYLTPADNSPAAPKVLPYLALIRAKLSDASLIDWPDGQNVSKALSACSGILRAKLTAPCLLELIWNYWHEEGMLVQTVNAMTRRFQNVRTAGDRDPLATLEIDPLRPLSNFLWGFIQDEQHRLTVVRRAYEYDHHYGLALVGKAVPALKGADSRTQFLQAFHGLLHLCTLFYAQDDDTTVIADGFPVLNALRDVHIILSQGAHNQYGDLPWTARQEMLMQEWVLARPEMREFLPTRIMVAYPEAWMDRVDAMKSLMGWTDTSVLHFRELGVYGERLLLGIRFNNWTDVIEPERAANWARFWRPEVQGYIHAYRAVTGVDLAERADAAMPSLLLRGRLAEQRAPAR